MSAADEPTPVFLAQLLDWPSRPDFKARLWHVAERICYALP
jgi:hypothetical protein